jgi:tRNA pseudouridine55 synthase
MDGILNILKPSGPTSFDIVARIKRLLHEPHVGHGGTLDPLASGVLPVFIGRATRVAEYLMEYPKTYRAGMELGITTTTYDAEGEVISRRDASNITLMDIEKTLVQFRGDIQQKPPAYSALKHEGQPLYKLAREGKAVEIESRAATIYRLGIIDFEPPLLTLDVECSKGTYIRSIAYDLGEALGCGAYLKSLIRTKYGPFEITQAVTLEQLQEAVERGAAAALIQPLDAVLSLWDKITLTGEQVEAVKCGVWQPLEAPEGAVRLAAYDEHSDLLALLSFDEQKKSWRPRKVFLQAQAEPKTSLDA